MPHLLLVDDDPSVLNINRNYFESRDFSASVAQTIDRALDYVKKYPVDCMILDIMTPGFDGLPLCRRFKTQVTVPVIFLTSLAEKGYLYQGFSLDGDDFLTKPWDLKEPEMWIRAKIGQCSDHSLKGERLGFPPLTIDADTHQASMGNVCVPLTTYELDILPSPVRSPGHVFSPDSIYREIWKLPDLDNIRTVKVYVARIWHKVEATYPGHSLAGAVQEQGYRLLSENS